MSDPPAGDAASDTARSVIAVTSFGLALGATAVVFPLLALASGVSPPVVGLLTAMSGAAQLTSRFVLPWLLARVADRTLIVTACLCLALSAVTLMMSTTLLAFAVAQVLQGIGRALFWTSSQTHVVRAPGVALRKLAQVQVAGHVGALAGPALAGSLLALSPTLALGVAVVASVCGAVSGLLLAYRLPYARRRGRGRRVVLWRRRAVALGCWTSFSAGGWRGILDSFVPVVLATAGLGAAQVGWLMAVAEGAAVVVGIGLARFGSERFAPLVRVSALAVLVGAGALPAVASRPPLAALALALAGAGGGLASSLGPAIVNGQVDADDQGRAIALAGTYRAASRLSTPVVLATAGGVVGVSAALGLAAVSIVAPVILLDRARPGHGGAAP